MNKLTSITRSTPALAALVIAVALGVPCRADVVYDNTTSPAGGSLGSFPGDQTVGELVKLAGTARNVTQVDFIALGADCCVIPGPDFTADFSLYFYNVGAANVVGGELAPVVTLTDVAVTAGPEFMLSFSGLSVAVPDEFIVAFSSSSISATDSHVAVSHYGPTTVGTSDKTFAYLKPNATGFTTGHAPFTGTVDNIGLRITAVPEPSAFALVGLVGGVGLGISRWRRVKTTRD